MRTLPFSPPPLPLCFLGAVWGLLQFLVSYKITTRAYPGHRHGKTTSDHARGAREAGRWDLVAARAVKEAARWDLAAVRAVRDTLLLADMLYSGNKRSMCAQSKFLPTLPCATEPHAFVVGAVRGFLDRTEAKSDKNWENCAALLPGPQPRGRAVGSHA
ncbi:FRIGIDA-like protein [Hordeum vulgare]|nr:FRIGIDA-like protein [Hordeum vulgare]